MSIISPTTARELLHSVASFGPSAEGEDLLFATEPSESLYPSLTVLHTGVRAVLTGRCWWGAVSDRPRVEQLSPDAPIPVEITLLAVEGDSRWDRISPDARLALPLLFGPANQHQPRQSRSRATVLAEYASNE